jgi:ERCC4-type nuclease
MLKNDIPLNIIADDRECKSEVIASKLRIEDVNVRIRRLSMGDYQIDNRLIVERMTLKDFVAIKRKARLETEDQHE